jgi:hypothetical protein
LEVCTSIVHAIVPVMSSMSVAFIHVGVLVAFRF